MNRRGIEFTLAQVEPGLWRWRFQIGDRITCGKTRTRLIRLATRRVHTRIDATLKASSSADHSAGRKI